MPLCVKAARENAELVRRRLAGEGLIDDRYAPCRHGGYVYFPVKSAPPGMRTENRKCQKRQKRGKSLKDELKGKLTDKELGDLVKSFDIVGDIAVAEIPPSLEKKQKLIASAIMKNHRNVKVVAKKLGGTYGEYRIRPVEVIAGERRTRTVHKEGGCEFELDLNKSYFSPRLGTERERIAGLVKPGENVLVPFAGVGPFAIRIAKKQKQANVVGVELNPDAFGYFEMNIARNRLKNVSAILGDVREVFPGEYKGWANRIVMPLPKDSISFLEHLLPCLKRGGCLHYYSFGSAAEPYLKAEREIESASEKMGRGCRIVFRRIVRPYSKEVEQVVVDALIE
ncbi:MAG: class I SAM-dependent methyltransferase family protein [Candidatus Micrarchaeota archaeon]|nr:class I SAM-dependent methyltransferase family protein [Candidatus Micrarchaeota archaeon]